MIPKKYYIKSATAKVRPYWTGKGWTGDIFWVLLFDSQKEANDHMFGAPGNFSKWCVEVAPNYVVKFRTSNYTRIESEVKNDRKFQFISPELTSEQGFYMDALGRAVAQCMEVGVSAYEVRNYVLLATDRICRMYGGDFSRGAIGRNYPPDFVDRVETDRHSESDRGGT